MSATSWARVRPVVDRNVRTLCQKAYPGHPRGCPNYGRRSSCPPGARTLPDVADGDRVFYVIWNDFDIGAHVARMKGLHPEWTDPQARCCLYWQAGARKTLRKRVDEFLAKHPGLSVTYCPEAMGVNVTATMRQAGITLEWPPIKIARQVALAYVRKRRK